MRGSVTPGYTAVPAPLGLADYGLGTTPYAYNTSHFLGQVTFASPPNATDPGSRGVIDPGGAHDGYVGSLNEFGVQLNTIAVNITVPGSDSGVYWTQNVVDWNDTGIHFVDDTFNFSSLFTYIPPGTIYSGCNNSTSGVDQILYVYGGVFQCVGGTISVSPASYPVTLQLFNNVSVNAQNRDQVAYGYRIVEAGTGHVFSGVSDTVVFNNPSGHTPSASPEFSVDGFRPTPGGLLADAELDLVGDIGGDNAMFRAVNGTLNLEYSNLSAGSWRNVPSAYNYGSDTGETSEGIADYWEPNGTLVVHQGPSMLYGLWNATPSVAVPSGDLHLAGNVTPSYGFVFVSNTPPVADPFAKGAPTDNLSWLPTNDTGGFDTYLPPLGGSWASAYFVEALADGFAETNGTPVSSNNTSYSLVLTPAPGSLRAPLYAFSNAQAASLAQNVSGSASLPYAFRNLILNVNASFDHLNDYDYPTFELVSTQGVTQPVEVDNVLQGYDYPLGNLYFIPLGPPPHVLWVSLGSYTSQIEFVGGSGDRVTNEVITGYENGQGGGVVLWRDTAAEIVNVSIYGEPAGGVAVFVGDSSGTLVENLSAHQALGVEDLGSSGTTGRNITVSGGTGVEALSSSGGRFSWINVTYGFAVAAGADFGASVRDDTYYDLPGTVGLTLRHLNATVGVGANVTFSAATTLTNVTTDSGLGAVELDGTTGTSVASASSQVDDFGILLYNATWTNVTGMQAERDIVGAVLFDRTTRTVLTRSVFFDNAAFGVEIFNATSNLVYDNSFLENNGSTLVYNPATIQAFSSAGNAFNTTSGTGNYWSDWHSFNGSHLNPYPISNGVEDFHPLLSGPGTYLATFTESGLPSRGKQWTVVVGGLAETSRGSSRSPTNTTIAFRMPNGTFPFVIVGPAGYEAKFVGPVGTLYVNGSDLAELVTFQAGPTYGLTFGETGLGRTTSWCVTLAGTWKTCGGKPSLTFPNLTPTVYSFALGQIGNLTTSVKVGRTWVQEVNGWADVSKATKVDVAYDYEVSFDASGLPTLTPRQVTIVGQGSFSWLGGWLYVPLPNGTYTYKVTVADGDSLFPASGRFVVAGDYPTIFLNASEVVFYETGLPNGAEWNVTLNKVTVTGTVSAGTGTIVFYEGNGTYAYRVGPVPGYTRSSSPKKAVVNGAPVYVDVVFAKKK